jgi:hypothetical protein
VTNADRLARSPRSIAEFLSMPNAMDIGFSFRPASTSWQGGRPAERKEETMTSIQNVLDRQRVEVVTISPSETVKDIADRMRAPIAAPVETNGAAVAGR